MGLPAFALVKVLAPAFFARQDTKSPVRAGVAAMLANMLMNVVFVGILFLIWRGPSDLADGWLAGIARMPGLHMALALASALASYLNLWLLWRALRRDGIYVRQSGWGRHLARLMAACGAMVAVLLVGIFLWQGWSDWPTAVRVLRLCILIGVAGVAFVGVLFASGFRMRDLRAH